MYPDTSPYARIDTYIHAHRMDISIDIPLYTYRRISMPTTWIYPHISPYISIDTYICARILFHSWWTCTIPSQLLNGEAQICAPSFFWSARCFAHSGVSGGLQ